jgi:hypothetical protein
MVVSGLCCVVVGGVWCVLVVMCAVGDVWWWCVAVCGGVWQCVTMW